MWGTAPLVSYSYVNSFAYKKRRRRKTCPGTRLLGKGKSNRRGTAVEIYMYIYSPSLYALPPLFIVHRPREEEEREKDRETNSACKTLQPSVINSQKGKGGGGRIKSSEKIQL